MISSSYEKVTSFASAFKNSISLLPVTSFTTGSSSKISKTRFPAAKVFCKVLPRLAKAITGPNDENNANVEIKTPLKPMIFF